MIVAASLAMMLAAAPSADAVGTGRKEFSKCLSAQTQPALGKKLSVGDFQSAIKSACADKESAFRNAIIAQDKADKMSDADAKSDADDQISEYVDKITSEYEESSRPN
jgi:membrane-anchored protein YejM (alkaline phosphatase superfamily)